MLVGEKKLKVNQVVMLRPTQSSIIFIQQLGRELRKSENKDFLTVIDFIGNYKTNYTVSYTHLTLPTKRIV